MSARVKRLGILVLAISTLLLYWGCTQPDDVITPVTASRLTLKPERLPTNPAGTIYQLWAANGEDTIPIAKFAWNFDSNAFYDSVGTAKRADSNQFTLTGDILNYRTVFVSVEPVPDPQPNKPNAIMLIDTVNTLELNTTKLRFPHSDSLYNGFLFYDMDTPSDSDIHANDGYGVWFSGYNEKRDSTQDTLAMLSYHIDTTTTCDDTITQNNRPSTCDSIVMSDITNVRLVLDTVVFGLDTVYTRYIRYDSVLTYDHDFPFTKDVFSATYTVDPPSGKRYFTHEIFTQPSLYLPDLSQSGWVYRGWVMSPVLNSGCGSSTFSKPAWINTGAINTYLPQNNSMMLSTGAFTNIAIKDEGNPYTLGSRVPDLPGEDFLENLPCAGGLPIDGFVPSGGGVEGQNGCVFISLEPVNFSPTSSTNFPLIVLAADIPVSRATVTIDSVYIPMRNWTSATAGDLQGFPLIIVNIERL